MIECNRRRIGAKLLLAVAEHLRAEPSVLSEGAEAALIAALREGPPGRAARSHAPRRGGGRPG